MKPIHEHVRLQEVVDKTCSLKAFAKNVRREYHAGKTAKGVQHVAIALSILKRACGVDPDTQGSAKDIVKKGGGKLEGRFIPLDRFMELGAASLRERISGMGSWGPDYTVAMGIHGVGTSPSASTSPEKSRYNIQHTAYGIVKGRRRKKGTLGVKANPVGQGTRF